VGDYLLGVTDKFTSAIVETESGIGDWLEVSSNHLWTTAATTNFTAAAPGDLLYLHLDENLTGQLRKGSITVQTSTGAVKKIYIQQLPALPIGRFGYDGGGSNADNQTFPLLLYTEQLYEFTARPTHAANTTAPIPNNNNIYNGLGTARANFNSGSYSNSTFDWDSPLILQRVINYCAYKNRPSTKSADGTPATADIKWYLPSQAQLMAMWASYESYKNVPTSTFYIDDSLSGHWSSTVNVLYPAEAQYLNFYYGNVGHIERSTKDWARCVRNGGAVSTMVTSNGVNMDINFTIGMPAGALTGASKGNGLGNDASSVNATLYDNLRIREIDTGIDQTWNQAQQTCNALNAGTSGWRLPTQKELQAIWILNPEIKSLGVAGFTNFADDYYWTATESSAYPQDAYMVYMSSGPAGDAGNTPHIVKTHLARVRCVRELP
jgi:hypothetical protein